MPREQKPKNAKKFVRAEDISKTTWFAWISMFVKTVFGIVFYEPLLWMFVSFTPFYWDRKNKQNRPLAIVLHDVHGLSYLRTWREGRIRIRLCGNYHFIEPGPLCINYINSVDIETIATKVVTMIRNRMKEMSNPDQKPLLIIGIGLGGVLATFVENKLREFRKGAPCDVITIAAPLNGTIWGRVTPGMLEKQLGKKIAKVYDPENKQRLHPGVFNLPKNVNYHHVYSATDFSNSPAETAVVYRSSVCRLETTPNRYVATDSKTLDFVELISKHHAKPDIQAFHKNK